MAVLPPRPSGYNLEIGIAWKWRVFRESVSAISAAVVRRTIGSTLPETDVVIGMSAVFVSSSGAGEQR